MRLALVYRRVDPSKGGAETYVADLARRLVAAGHAVDLIAEGCADGALPERVGLRRVVGRGLTRAGRIWGFAVAAEAALAERRRDYDCTIGFINTWGQDVLIPQSGVRRGSLEHNARRFPAGWRRQLYGWAKRANPKDWIYRAIEARQYAGGGPPRVVAVSELVKGHLQRFHGVDPGRIRVVYNAIDADRLMMADPAAARREFREAAGAAVGEPLALFLAHNYALKGLAPLLHALAIHAARADAGRMPAFRLAVCGSGRPGAFERLATRLGIANRVAFLGFRPDVRPCFAGADAFVLPSYYDPCSLVVFEALAAGLPVVTTACNGAGELIGEGREGYVVPSPDDIEGLAAALDRLAEPGRRESMAESAARLGREQTMDRHVSKILDVCREAAGERARAGGPLRPARRGVASAS